MAERSAGCSQSLATRQWVRGPFVSQPPCNSCVVPASARSTRVLCQALEERALQLLARPGSEDAVLPPLAAARVWAATLCALLSWWTEQGLAASVEEMQAMLAAATVRGNAPA